MKLESRINFAQGYGTYVVVAKDIDRTLVADSEVEMLHDSEVFRHYLEGSPIAAKGNIILDPSRREIRYNERSDNVQSEASLLVRKILEANYQGWDVQSWSTPPHPSRTLH